MQVSIVLMRAGLSQSKEIILTPPVSHSSHAQLGTYFHRSRSGSPRGDRPLQARKRQTCPAWRPRSQNLDHIVGTSDNVGQDRRWCVAQSQKGVLLTLSHLAEVSKRWRLGNIGWVHLATEGLHPTLRQQKCALEYYCHIDSMRIWMGVVQWQKRTWRVTAG